MKQWYYAEHDEKKGPLDEPAFMERIRTGRLSEETLVWSEGMDDWATVRDLQMGRLSEETLVWSEGMDDWATVRDLQTRDEPPAEAATSSISEMNNHKGIGRGGYFGVLIVCCFIQSLTSKTPEILWLVAAVALFAGGMRLRNIGYNPWGSLLLLVPLVNLVIAYRCLAYPAGYAHSRQSDLVMNRVSWIYAIAIIGIVLSILIPLIEGR